MRRLLAALLLLSPARATAAGLAGYEAPAGCPTREQLDLPLHQGSDPPSFDLLVKAENQGFRAIIVVRDGPGQTTTRELVGETCGELVGAARLVIALALALPLGGPEEPQPAAQPPATPREPAAPAWGLGAQLEIRGGAGPKVEASPGLFVSWRGTNWLLQMGLAGARSGATDRDASFSLITGQLTGCAGGLATRGEAGGHFAFSPCLRVEPGLLVGAGEKVAHAAQAARLHLGAGLLGRVEFSWARATLFAEAGALGLASRPRFYFGPDTTIYEPPVVAAFGGLGADLLFW